MGYSITWIEFQSTRPRGARLIIRHAKPGEYYVSIHAPAWGATYGAWGGIGVYSVSIHAPAWGATCIAFSSSDSVIGFNPRARVGRDGRNESAKGDRCRFQSTRPRGARQAGEETVGGAYKFQSTRPRGARLIIVDNSDTYDYVSIHAPAWGATSGVGLLRRQSEGFQSTRPRGARRA